MNKPMMTLGMLKQMLPGTQMLGDPATPIWRVHTDTRTLQPGDLFVALRGDRFDAHEFLPQAASKGATAVLAERDVALSQLPGVQVADARQALAQLAAAWRKRFDIPLVAVTGSNGKTTVTQMVASILRAWMAQDGTPDAALSTQANFNNDIGVPLTLLRLREGVHRCAVVELGMNHPGEIAHLAHWASPTVALVNNAQREHQEFMHTVEAVARENGSVFAHLREGGVAVYPADDVAHTPIWRDLAAAHARLEVAPQSDAPVTGQAQWVPATGDVGAHWRIMLQTPAGQGAVPLFMAGQHNVRNALTSAAAAIGAGAPWSAVVAGLSSFVPVKGRSALLAAQVNGISVNVVDDSYNANPDSVRAAIDMLADLPGPHWLLLGDMGEVGDQGEAFHAEVGQYARERGIAHFWAAGSLCQFAAKAYGPEALVFATSADMVATLQTPSHVWPQAQSILIKGSRFMKMEAVVQTLTGGQHAA
jgi:UDP-N-acetylmuramoyl-tripeptide--D-alanyl-D-alanine ligase